jgi:hypothetical protein
MPAARRIVGAAPSNFEAERIRDTLNFRVVSLDGPLENVANLPATELRVLGATRLTFDITFLEPVTYVPLRVMRGDDDVRGEAAFAMHLQDSAVTPVTGPDVAHSADFLPDGTYVLALQILPYPSHEQRPVWYLTVNSAD